MNNRLFLKVFAGVLAVAVLSSCSTLPRKYQYIRNNSNDYRSAKSLKPLSVPPGYNTANFSEHFVVPNPQLAKPIATSSLLPPDLDARKIPKEKHWW